MADYHYIYFMFAMGAKVQWAEDRGVCWEIVSRRYTERSIMPPYREYGLSTDDDRTFRWAYEADLAPWPIPDGQA